MADPATFQLQTVFSDLLVLWEQLVYSLMGKNRYFCVNIVNINILSLTSLSRTPQWASHSSTWSVCQGLEADSESVLVRMSSAFYRTRNNQMCAGWCVYWNTVCWIHFSGLVDVQHKLFISCTWTDISALWRMKWLLSCLCDMMWNLSLFLSGCLCAAVTSYPVSQRHL